MTTIADAVAWGIFWLLFMAVCFGIGYMGTAVVEYGVRALLFLRKGCPVGVDMRLCTPCTRVTPGLIYRHGHWMCLLCETRHPAQAAS